MHGQPHFIFLVQLCHVYISLLHVHVMFTYHCYTCMSCLHITVIVSLFLSYGFPFILHVLLFHGTIVMLYDCFLLLIWLFPILDMRAVDMRYVESHIYCSRYIVPVFRYIVPLYCSCFSLYCSMLSTELWSSYHVTRIMYCYLFLLHWILDISDHNDNWGMGET